MNPELLQKLRALLGATPDATRVGREPSSVDSVAAAIAEEERFAAEGMHSQRYHNLYGRLSPEQRREAVLGHMQKDTDPSVKEFFLSPSADSVFRATGLPAKVGSRGARSVSWNPYDEEVGAYRAGVQPLFLGSPETQYIQDAMTISPDTPQNMRNVLVHEGMHRRQSGQRGYSPNPERAGKFPGGAMAPYGERQEEQYANLGKSVYNLLAGNVPQNLDSALTSIDSRYPKSESSAREVAQDLIAGMRPPQAGRMYSTYLSRRMPTDSVPSVFQEHPLREALATKGNVQRVSAEEFAGRFKRK